MRLPGIFSTLIVLTLLFLILGCSGGDSITTPDNVLESANVAPDFGLMGAYELSINPDDMTAELVIKRFGAIGESWVVNGISYFTTAPCQDCLKISGLSLTPEGNVELSFSIKHPFEPGDPLKPPTAVNRLDLDIFDVAMIIAPLETTPTTFPQYYEKIYNNACVNPDGYTMDLFEVTLDDAAMPYFLVVDETDSVPVPSPTTWNKFAMGAEDEFDVVFALESGSTLNFDLYLTMGYGSSAVKADRLNPKYYNPEFNRKAAWKVVVTPPEPGFTWNDSDNATFYNVKVEVYDWQTDGIIATATDFADADFYQVIESSEVSAVHVEVAGMAADRSTVLVDDGTGTGMPGSPLVYYVPVRNENLLPVGEYPGLVTVVDDRIVGDPDMDTRDYLIDCPDGVTLENLAIPAFQTYQTFTATVMEECNGCLMWAKRASGTSFDFGYGITVLSDNSTVVIGEFDGTATFGPGESCETILTSAGNWDIFIAKYNPDGTLAWAKHAGGSLFDFAYGITTLSDNSTVVTGEFEGDATFGPGESCETTLTSEGGWDIFIAKYNTDGTLVWAKRAGGTSYDRSYEITTLLDNSTVVTGYFAGASTFGPGESCETILTSVGMDDIFIAKYNTDGTLVWAKRAGGTSGDSGYGITTISDYSTVVAGYFREASTFGPGESAETILTSAGNLDIFIAKYNSDGTLAWAKRAGGTSYDRGYGITTISETSIVLTGYFYDAATFGPGESAETILTSAGLDDIFIAYFNSDGTLAWAKRAGGSSNDCAYGVTTLSNNSTVVTGYFKETATFGLGEINETILTSAGDSDLFIGRLNTDGTIAWVKSAGGPGSSAYGEEITTLSDNSTVVTGSYWDSVTFGPGESNETNLPCAGESDIFIARYQY